MNSTLQMISGRGEGTFLQRMCKYYIDVFEEMKRTYFMHILILLEFIGFGLAFFYVKNFIVLGG